MCHSRTLIGEVPHTHVWISCIACDVFVHVQDLDEQVQFLIAARGIPLQVAPGHELCAQGDAADCVWLLHEGMDILFLGCTF